MIMLAVRCRERYGKGAVIAATDMSDDQPPSPPDAGTAPEVVPPNRITDAIAGAMFGVQRPVSGGGWQPPGPEQLQGSFPNTEICGMLGRGGMGAVYKGWQKSLQRFVAIKILPYGVDDGGMDFAARFKQEARAMAKFKHPGIVGVYDAGETPEGMLYFVMEYVEGTDVAQFVAEHGRLSPGQALGIACRVCEALTYAHVRGVVHRDIKPSNVMIEPDGTVKIADFGLAKLSGADSHVNTVSSFSIGTPDFMPPEAFHGSRHVDHRGDIYAAGGLLYQMLTGRAPHGRFEPPSVLVPGLDRRLDDIMDKAMQPDPDKRYASAAALHADLTRVIPSLKLSAAGATQAPGESRRRVAAKLVIFGLLVTAILGAYTVAIGRWNKNRPGTPAGNVAQADAAGAAAGHRDWRPAPAKVNAVFDRDAVHLERFDTWGTGDIRKTNVAVRATIAWQPSPPGSNDLIKVTARSTDTEHYYACLYGRNVELGHYRSPKMIPLQRWRVEPPPAPDEAVSLQLACVGRRLAVWVRGRLVGVFEDDVVAGPGRVGVQAIDGHIRTLEYLDLDGLADAAAFQRLGLDATGTAARPSREWVQAFPELSKLPEIAEFVDGWARLSDKAGIKHLADPDGKALFVRNGGLRAQRRVPEHWQGGVLLHARSVAEGRRVNFCYFEPKMPGEKAYLQLRQFQPETLPPNSTSEEAWAAQKLLAEERIPTVSGEVTTELIVVGNTVRGRMGDHIVTATFEDDGKAGRLALDVANTLSFRGVEVLNLDSLPEAEALNAAGMKPIPAKSATTASAATGGTASWRDAFAESPLKEVIEKAERTTKGYLLPDSNHWFISPEAHCSGAIRVRAAAVNAQFISLFALLDDGQAERLRFRDLSKQWKLSRGEAGVDETDIASATGASPMDGQIHELLFARFGGRLRAMLDGQLLFDEATPSSTPGRLVLDVYRRATVWVEKVEYLELDGIPEAEALKLIGLAAGGNDSPGAPSRAVAATPKPEPWVDLLTPEASAQLRLDGIEKPGTGGMVVPVNGKATVTGTGGRAHSDGALRFRARFEIVTGSRLAIRARYNNGATYALTALSRSKVALQIWFADGTTKTLRDFAPRNPLKPGQDYELELRAVGTTLTARLNGETLGQVEDATFPEGAFSIGLGTGQAVTVRALEYLDLSAPGAAGASPAVRLLPGGSGAATKQAPFVNSLGMKFVPVPITGGPTNGKRVLFSVWETRVQDYEAFAKATNREWPKPGFEQGPTHPAVSVNWDDAQAFCAWLTERERKAGRLGAAERYRLPSDHEWSCAVGIGDREDPALSPMEKSGKILDVFPWGDAWPPPPGAGNYSGEEAAGREISPTQKLIEAYRDDFATTAPAGSFSANQFGIFALGGNAWEWCEDFSKDGDLERVMRGGCFRTSARLALLSSNRNFTLPLKANNACGIRLVLEVTSSLPAAGTGSPAPQKGSLPPASAAGTAAPDAARPSQ